MAKLIINRLKSIEIEEDDRNIMLMALGMFHCQLQPVHQQQAVWQLGERIVVRDLLQLMLMLFVSGDIGKDRDIVERCIVFVSHHADGE